MSKQISIVVPLFNEEESLPHLIDWITKVLDTKYSYEVLLVDDGSKDQSWKIIEGLVQKMSLSVESNFNVIMGSQRRYKRI